MGRNWRRAYLVLSLSVLLGALTPAAWGRFQIPPPCKNAFTVDQEKTEGAKYAAQVFKEMPVLPDNSPLSQYVRQLGAKLVAVAPGYQWPFNFHVVASEEINAFALPGGAMFVNVGAIRAAETESQLAGVMAHELSHVILRHSTCNITKQQAPRMWAGIGQLAAGVLLGDGALGSLATQGIGIAAGMGFLKMSREDEKQADLLGTDILYDAGYDPRGLPQFFETIQAKYGAGGTEWLSDHPNPGNRMQYVNAEIASLPRRQNPRVTSAEFTRAHDLAMKEKVYTAKEVQVGAWRQTGHFAAVPGGPATVMSSPMVPGAVRLSRAALGLNDQMVGFQGRGFVVSYPVSWQKGGGSGGGVAFAPQNGAGEAGIAYGVVIDGARWKGGVRDANSLQQATIALAQQLSRDNGGMQQVGDLRAITVGGQPGSSLELRGRSPVADGGDAAVERDWLVTVARPDGDLNYMVMIAPEGDFETLRPIFTAMVGSFHVQ